MGSVLVDGKIIGSITVERLTLRGEAIIHGNITCKSLTVDPTVIIIGSVNVHPQAPRHIDTDGRLLPEPEDTSPPPKKLGALGMSKSMSKISKNDPLAPVVSKEDLLRHTSDEKLTSSATIGDADKPKIVKPSTKPHDVSPEHGNIHGEKTSKSAVDTADNSLVVDAKKQHHSESDNGLEEEVAGVDEEKVGQEQDDA